MEVKIGIQMAPRELVVDTSASPSEIERALRAALADGMVFAITAENGGTVLVPADKIAYVELDLAEPRKIGFASSTPARSA